MDAKVILLRSIFSNNCADEIKISNPLKSIGNSLKSRKQGCLEYQFLSIIRALNPGSDLAAPQSPVTHSSGDPPCRGSERTTQARVPPDPEEV